MGNQKEKNQQVAMKAGQLRKRNQFFLQRFGDGFRLGYHVKLIVDAL